MQIKILVQALIHIEVHTCVKLVSTDYISARLLASYMANTLCFHHIIKLDTLIPQKQRES